MFLKGLHKTTMHFKNNYYGLAVAIPYVGMARKQDGGFNQCISVYTAITGKQMLASTSI